MHSPSTLAVMSALAGSALAQSTTVASLYLYGVEGSSFVASVVAAAPEATTYFVNCPPGTDSTECGLGPGMSFVEGPSTLGLHFTQEGAFTMDVDCAVASQTASCIETDAGPEANDPGTSTAMLSDLSASLVPVTITAGLDLLSAGAGGNATASAMATASGETFPTKEASTGASATETSATKTSTGVATVTAIGGAAGRADRKVVLAGVAGVVGMAMAL